MLDFGVELNWLAIIVGVIVMMVLGFIWYAKSVFGRAWAKEVGISEEEMDSKDGMAGRFALMIVSAILQVAGVAYLLSWLEIDAIGDALLLAFLIWLAFMGLVVAAGNGFAKRTMKESVITQGYQLVGMLIVAAILVSWA